MNSFEKWLTSYNITTHTVAAAAAFLIAAFYAVPPFHALVIHVYQALPSWVEETAAAIVAVYAWYRKGEPAASDSKLAE
jgi:hypothetical protein